MPSCPATRPRARCNLTRNAALEQPATTAASRGDRPSQATKQQRLALTLGQHPQRVGQLRTQPGRR